MPGLPNLLGSTVNILIAPPTCIYREFLETGLVPSWDEINFQFLHKTEHYSLPGSERVIVGEPVQPSHSSPAACAKGRVLWGLFTQRAPEHLPARRLAIGGWVAIQVCPGGPSCLLGEELCQNPCSLTTTSVPLINKVPPGCKLGASWAACRCR